MNKLKQSFNNVVQHHTLSEFIGYGLALTVGVALAAELAVMPFVMGGRLDRQLKEAIKTKDAPKVEQVLSSHYSGHLWGNWNDSNGNKKRQYLGDRLCEATQMRDPASIDAILKNDPQPYEEIRRSSGAFVPFMSDHVYENYSTRACSVGLALANGDVKAVDTFIAHGVKVGDRESDLRSIGNSKELIAYFLAKPERLAANDLVTNLVKLKAPVENIQFAIERNGAGSQFLEQPMAAAIAVAGDAYHGDKAYGLAVTDVLLKHGANPDASLRDESTRYGDKVSALSLSMTHGTADTTKRLVQARADVNAALQGMIKDNVNPYKLQGWDESVKQVANEDTLKLVAMADQQRAYLETLKKAPAPGR